MSEEQRTEEEERLNVALKIAGANIIELNEKCEQMTQALLRAMALVDQLLQENVRLCAASNEPPPIQLFAAKNSFDTAMKKLLGDET